MFDEYHALTNEVEHLEEEDVPVDDFTTIETMKKKRVKLKDRCIDAGYPHEPPLPFFRFSSQTRRNTDHRMMRPGRIAGCIISIGGYPPTTSRTSRSSAFLCCVPAYLQSRAVLGLGNRSVYVADAVDAAIRPLPLGHAR